MNVYQSDDTIICSMFPQDLRPLPDDALCAARRVVFLTDRDPRKSKASFALDHPGLILAEESLDWINSALLDQYDAPVLSGSLPDLIKNGSVRAVNVRVPGYRRLFAPQQKKPARVNILAMGDVGGTLAVGLRLLGGDVVERIGIFDVRREAMERWEQELNQIQSPDPAARLPRAELLEPDRLFDCDVFVFCASMGVPPVGSNVADVRMYQYGANARLIRTYAREARNSCFRGIFAVVSDPVDLLCKTVLEESNRSEEGIEDFLGLLPEQVQGYGLGVMAARAAYYAARDPRYARYLAEGRAFGPHGQGLVIADSVEHYDDERSRELTGLALTANRRIREAGYKPYIAPALSSGALSILAMLRGQWHYSSNFLGGVYLGTRCRVSENGLQMERSPLPDILARRIGDAYNDLMRCHEEQNRYG